MQPAQIIAWDVDGSMLEALRALAEKRGAWLREVRRRDACWNLVRQADPGVLVLKLDAELEEKLDLLEQAARLFPRLAIIVQGDAPQPTLAALAWDLGATFVLLPPQNPAIVPEVVQSFLA